MRGFKDISSFVRGVVAVAAMLFSSVMLYAQEPGRTDADFELGRATEILANIMREFDTGYVDEVSVDVLLENASAGLVVATDPYSEYLSEKSMEEFEVIVSRCVPQQRVLNYMACDARLLALCFSLRRMYIIAVSSRG